MLPFGNLPVREGMTLLRRAVDALERQAELMAEPETGEPANSEEFNVALQKANGAGYIQAKRFFGQKLEDILDAGYEASERAGMLRKLSDTMNGTSNKKKD